MARVNVHCAACHWNSSRAPRTDCDYGPCPRCGALLAQSRPWSARRPVPVFVAELAPIVDRDTTWPELIAAELQRMEDGGASPLPKLLRNIRLADGGLP